jgi:phosphatidylglycerophosphate synthase
MNWQIRPLPPRTCTFKPQNFYVGAILNVVTDVIMLAIPLPMLWGLQLKFSKKLAIGLFICSGTFVIAAAIVRAALTLGNTPSGLNINRWGVRETIVGIITVNLPILRPMFRKGFWRGSGFVEESSSYARSRNPTKGGYGHGTFELRSQMDSKNGPASSDVELVTVPRSSSRSSGRSSDLEKDGGDGTSIQNGIVVVEQTYHVSSAPRNDGDEELGSWEREGKAPVGRTFRTNITSAARP